MIPVIRGTFLARRKQDDQQHQTPHSDPCGVPLKEFHDVHCGARSEYIRRSLTMHMIGGLLTSNALSAPSRYRPSPARFTRSTAAVQQAPAAPGGNLLFYPEGEIIPISLTGIRNIDFSGCPVKNQHVFLKTPACRAFLEMPQDPLLLIRGNRISRNRKQFLDFRTDRHYGNEPFILFWLNCQSTE